jgi:hypothetical protein
MAVMAPLVRGWSANALSSTLVPTSESVLIRCAYVLSVTAGVECPSQSLTARIDTPEDSRVLAYV